MASEFSGIVTFLFTDIEGSTRLAQMFHDGLAGALHKHNSILHKATENNNGHVFRIVGDAFCCAFGNSSDAVRAAVDAQRMLMEEEWGEVEIRVRMGIHSGYAEWNGTDYMGYITLARTNRVMSAAYGRQILISDNSHDSLVLSELQPITFRDLGQRRLKDLIQPMGIYQIISPDLESDFPPLKTLDARPNNLPVQLTSFIGREGDLAEVKNLIASSRLVTLIGTGGTGKTRLALQAGAELIDDYSNGVWFIDLAPVADANLMIREFEKAFGIAEQPNQDPQEIILDYLDGKELLIILDNCEHLISESSALAETILQKSRDVKILATSRESLRCRGELTYLVKSLGHPDPKDNLTLTQLTQYESVRLFIERALTLNPGFRVNNENAPALAQICSQLDGIPLAIELAAARTRVLSMHDICRRLEDRFNLLTGGKRTAMPRQKTLRAMIDWSYDLLADNEQRLWRRLSVFSGGWTLQDAEEVCSDVTIDPGEVLDLSNELLEKSVISYSEDTERFRMLETIRQYGREKLEASNETYAFQRRHFDYHLRTCENSLNEMTGARSRFWMDKFESEYSNIQSALRFGVESGLIEEGNRLAFTLGKFWEVRGYIKEGKSWLDKLLESTSNVSPLAIANSKRLAGVLATIMSENIEANELLKDALSIYRELDNTEGLSQTLNVLGLVAFDLSRWDEATAYLAESLALKRRSGNKIGICSSLNSLGLLHTQQGEYEEALRHYEEALGIAEELKDEMYMAILYNNIAEVFDNLCEFEKSVEYFEKGIEIDREFGNKSGICISLYNLALIAAKKNDTEAAERLFSEGIELSNEIGFKMAAAYSYLGTGLLAIEKNEIERAEKIFITFMNEMRQQADTKCLVLATSGIARIEVLKGNYERACNLAGSLVAMCERFEVFIDRNISECLDKIIEPSKSLLGEIIVDDYLENGKSMELEILISEICQEKDSPGK